MIRDLNRATGGISIEADIGIVGGGIAGLVLAMRLHKAGLRVAVLESGDQNRSGPAQDLNEVEFTGMAYRGATDGRVRGLGGTSTAWGGALLPFFPDDFDERPEVGLLSWPISHADVLAYAGQVDRLFGLTAGGFDSLSTGRRPGWPPSSEAFVPRYAKWPTFARRNLATLCRTLLDSPAGPAVWLNATVTGFELDKSRTRLTRLTARAPSGAAASLSARHFVLCAGAIECTRLLLWLNEQRSTHSAISPALGRYFHDHISSPLAEIDAAAPERLNRMAGFCFERNTMRSFRYELTPAARRRHRTAGGFCHIAFRPVGRSGFDDLRRFMQSIQRRQPEFMALARSAADVRYLVRLLHWRVVHGQLCWPRPTRLQLHVVAEQVPVESNAISLSAQMDRYGMPKASLAWNILDRDVASLRNIACLFDTFWQESGLGAVGALRWLAKPKDIDRTDISGASDIFHPGGTTRMGHDAASSVVDRNLTVWAIPNLSVASTSIFPAGAGANPTMMLIMFTMRLADHLVQMLSQSSTIAAVS
jgi:choline dehydrogenase-like flavoprotein